MTKKILKQLALSGAKELHSCRSRQMLQMNLWLQKINQLLDRVEIQPSQVGENPMKSGVQFDIESFAEGSAAFGGPSAAVQRSWRSLSDFYVPNRYTWLLIRPLGGCPGQAGRSNLEGCFSAVPRKILQEN